MQATRQSPKKVNSQIPADLETILLKAISPRRDDRYATAAELAEDLRRFHEQRPIAARRQSRLSHAKNWMRRNRGLSAVGSVALLLLVTFAIGGPIVAVRQTRLAERMQQLASEATEERNQATKNLHDACRLVDEVLAPAADVVNLAPGVQEMHAQLIDEGLKFYRKVAQEAGDDRVVRFGLANALLQVGKQNLHAGRDMRTPILEAINILRRLSDENPVDVRYRWALVKAHHELTGHYWSACEWKDGARLTAEGLRLAEAALRLDPADSEGLQRHLGLKVDHAYFVLRLGDPARAKTVFREILQLEPDPFHEQRSRIHHSDMLMQMGRYDEARSELTQAEEAVRFMATDNPSQVVLQRYWLCWVHDWRARCGLRTGELQLATDQISHAIDEMQALHRELPDVFWAKFLLGWFWTAQKSRNWRW